jgi:hypothetical protein
MHRERITIRGLLVLLLALAAVMMWLSYYTQMNV